MRALHSLAILFFCVSPLASVVSVFWWPWIALVAVVAATSLVVGFAEMLVEFLIEERRP